MCHRHRSRAGWLARPLFWHFNEIRVRLLYSRTTSEVLPTPVYVSNLLYGGLEVSGGS